MSTLVVPIDVQALVVPTASTAFRTWVFDYSALNAYNSPEPTAGGGQSSFQPRTPGVYLHWDLPAALRHGTSDPQSGPVVYPPVPNRWLVLRRSGTDRTATGWVVESDCPNSSSTAYYLVDSAILDAWTASGEQNRVQGASAARTGAKGGRYVTRLGNAFGAAGWQERAATATFLTAVAPGNVLFSAYETHCSGVFTFFDTMAGVSAGDAVSYLVAGWFSDPSEDPLSLATAASLGWGGVGKDAQQPNASVYEGFALAVPWQPGQQPASPISTMQGKVHVGVGPTTTDAFSALVAGQLGDPADIGLLKAFQYGLLPVLEKVNGPALLQTAVHQAAFGSKSGTTVWEIVPADAAKPTDPAPSATITLSADEAAWLNDLNTAQAGYEAALQTLTGYRRALYVLWWKWQRGLYQSSIVPVDGFDPKAYEAAVTRTLPPLIAAALSDVNAKAALVPQPITQPGDTRQDSFQRGVSAFASAKGLEAGKALKPVAGPRLWRSGDPVVVLSGVEPAPLPDPASLLACRLDDAVLSSLTAGGATLDATTLAGPLGSLPAATGMPVIIASLVVEAFLLDPQNAAVAAQATGADAAAVQTAMSTRPPSAYQGTIPANDLSAWAQQPWTALLMEWQLGYVAVPQQTNGTANWTFDGNDYRFTGPYGGFGSDSLAPLRRLGGIVPLTPEAQFAFGGQLKRFVDTYVTGHPDAPLDAIAVGHLYDAIDALDGWKFMSQALTGFGDLVALVDTRAQTGPDATVAAAVGSATDGVAYQPVPPYPFDALRRGQFVVQELIVYDTFGQVLQVVGGTGTTDPQNFAPVLDAALVPDKPVITKNPARLIQVSPRLMQHARLDLSLADARTDVPVVPGSSGNPLIAWLLPNHLDAGVLLYAPDGTALGEVALHADATGARTAGWQPPPHSSITLADLAATAPVLASIIGDPAFTAEPAFTAFLNVIDTTLWSIDPLGNRADQNLSVLVGRPLGLVRTSLRLVLDGPPVTDISSWGSVWPPPTPEFLGYPFPVRLGDLASRQDGVIGLWRDGSYGTFDSVAAPDAGQSYISQIGPVGQPTGQNYPTLTFGDSAPTYLNLLVDPRAAIHATTGILPVSTLAVPATFVDGALASLELTFTIGTALTHAEGEPPAIWLPVPAEQNGSWSWWERGAATWTSYDLLRATADARLKDYPNSVRDAFLQLVSDLRQQRT